MVLRLTNGNGVSLCSSPTPHCLMPSGETTVFVYRYFLELPPRSSGSDLISGMIIWAARLLGRLLLVPCMYMKQNILQEGEMISLILNSWKLNFQYFREVTVWCFPACPYLNKSIGDTRKTLHQNLVVQPLIIQ